MDTQCMQYKTWGTRKLRCPLSALSIACLSLLSFNSFAATEGTLGATSEGTAVITIIKEDAVLITDLDDLFLGTNGVLNANKTDADAVCVFSSTGSYNISITSVNGSFVLQSDTTTSDIAYSLNWITDTTFPVTYNRTIPDLIGDSASTNCNGTTNAIFQVTVTPEEFNSAEPGTYQDTLTLLVQPE